MGRSKKMVSFLLVLTMVFSFFTWSLPVNAAEESIPIQVTINENYTMASELFGIINENRAANGLNQYVMDSGLMDVAMQRAAEICGYFGHGAPSLPRECSCCELMIGTPLENGIGVNEDIGMGVDAASMYKLWKGSALHAGALLGASYNYCGIGSTIYHGTSYWVLIVSQRPLGNGMTPATGTVRKKHTVNILPRLLSVDGLVMRVIADDPRWSDAVCFKDMLTGDAGYFMEASNPNITLTNNNPELFSINERGQIKGNGHSSGTGSVTVSVKGGGTSTYQVNVEPPYRPYGNEFTVKVDGDNFVYDGNPIHPDISVYYGDEKCSRFDYRVSLKNNTDVGTATVTVTGADNTIYDKTILNDFYLNEKYVAFEQITGSATFNIVKDGSGNVKEDNESLNVPSSPETPEVSVTPVPPYEDESGFMPDDETKKFTVKVEKSSYTCTGKEIKPKISVYDYNGTPIYLGSCDVTYKNNINPGTATVMVRGLNGMEDCSGTATFKINAPKKLTLKLSYKSCSYTGNIKKPSVSVYVGSKKLSSQYYSVSYKNNRNVGKATVTVKGKGCYAGSSGSTTFNIYPGKPSILFLKSWEKSSLIVKWKKGKGPSGYQILFSTKSNFSNAKYKNVKSNYSCFSLNGLSSGKTYYVKVRSYKKVNGKYYCSSWSNVKKIKVR